MDPDETLTEMVSEARVVLAHSEHESVEAVALACRVLALHDWLSKGGFVPAAWAPPHRDTDNRGSSGL